MAYFPVDDDMAFHPKVLMAGNEAIGIWTRAGALSKKHFTGGFVTVDTARALGGDAEIQRLVSSGLWVAETDPMLGEGFRFHDWKQQAGNDDAVVERERAEKSRARNAQRQKEWRERNGKGNAVTNAPVTGGPSPSPSPMTSTYVNESQSLDNRAREQTDSLSVVQQQMAARAELDVERIRGKVLDQLGIHLTLVNALALGNHICSKPKKWPNTPTPYVLTSITRNPAEIEKHIYDSGLAS